MLTIMECSKIRNLAEEKYQEEWRSFFKSEPKDIFSVALIRHVLDAAIELGYVERKAGGKE